MYFRSISQCLPSCPSQTCLASSISCLTNHHIPPDFSPQFLHDIPHSCLIIGHLLSASQPRFPFPSLDSTIPKTQLSLSPLPFLLSLLFPLLLSIPCPSFSSASTVAISTARNGGPRPHAPGNMARSRCDELGRGLERGPAKARRQKKGGSVMNGLDEQAASSWRIGIALPRFVIAGPQSCISFILFPIPIRLPFRTDFWRATASWKNSSQTSSRVMHTRKAGHAVFVCWA